MAFSEGESDSPGLWENSNFTMKIERGVQFPNYSNWLSDNLEPLSLFAKFEGEILVDKYIDTSNMVSMSQMFQKTKKYLHLTSRLYRINLHLWPAYKSYLEVEK